MSPLTAMQNGWRGWVRVTSQRERGTTLALIRMCLGVIVVAALLEAIRLDLVTSLWMDVSGGGYRKAGQTRLIKLLGGPTPDLIWATIITGLVSGTLLIVGLGGRVTALVANQAWHACTFFNGDTRAGADLMVTIGLFMMILADSTVTMSLDCRIRTGKWTSDREVPSWPRYLIILQIVLVYFSTALHKISMVWSWSGSYNSIWWVIHNPNWNRWDVSGHPWLYPFTQVGTFVTWWWEVLWPLLGLHYWYRSTPERPGRLRALFNRFDVRKPLVLVGLGMHVGIHVLMDVGVFIWICATFYLSLFRPEELESGWRRLRAIVRTRDLRAVDVQRAAAPVAERPQ